MNLLRTGDWVALTESAKQYFLNEGYTLKKVNSLSQIEIYYEAIKVVHLTKFNTPLKVDKIIQLRFVDIKMPASYNVAANTFYNKLCKYKEQLVNLKDINCWMYGYYDNAVKANPLVKELVKQTEEELDYELSECQCSIAVSYFIKDKLRSNDQQFKVCS